MGQTTLQETKEALAAARRGETEPGAVPVAAELESLARSLDGPAQQTSGEAPAEEPDRALQQAGGA
ncbi:MAG: hypothetical protein K2W96_19640 [Gemmataceae bacterium]|nr:hypothetical protein [Gemmataceae bacterium]